MSVLERQPQLRGPHQPRREDELPGLAAAGGGLRAGGDDGHRPARRAARAGLRRRRRLPQGHLALRRGGRASWSRRPCTRRCSARPTTTSSRATSAGSGLEIPEGDRSPGTTTRPTCAGPSFLEDIPEEPTTPEDIEGARVLAKLGDSVTTDHISPAGAIKKGTPAGAVPERERRRAARLQLLRLAARQPRGDGARHVREHPPAQPDGAGHRGRLHAPHARRRGDDDLRRLDQVRRGRGRR